MTDTCVSAIQDTIKAVECCQDAHVFVTSAIASRTATPAAFDTLNQRLGQAAAVCSHQHIYIVFNSYRFLTVI